VPSYANINKLLNLLLLKNKLSSEEILEEVDSKCDIYNYVKEIKHIYKNELDVNIIEDGHIITLNILDEDKFYKHLYRANMYDFNDYKCRIAYLFYELIDKGIYVNILDLCDYMNVSRGTVNNDLKKAKNILKKYGAEIVGVPNKGIKLNGSEFSKRLILIYEVFDYFPSKIFINNKFINMIKSLSEHYKLNNLSRYLIYKSTLVSIYRIKNGNLLNTKIPMYKNFEANSSKLNDFITEIKNIFKININNEEIDFISFPINTRNSVYTSNVDNTKNEKQLIDIVNEMLKNVEEKFVIHIDKEDFFEKVRYHLLFLINRLIFKIPVRDIFSDQIKIKFPLAFELAKTSMNVLREKYNLFSTTVDISYLAVYFALILDERKTIYDESNNIKNAAVITNAGRGAFELIQRQLKEVIGLNSKIDFLTTSDLVTKDISEYGILFSTENVSMDVYLPIIQINGIIDKNILTQKINEIESRNNALIEKISEVVNINVMHLDGDKGYRNNVRLITEALIKEGIVSKNIYKNFEKKENLSSMIYENGVAFPHLTDKIVDKLNLTLGILNPEKDNLKIIFFLVIPEKMNSIQEEMLMKMYNYLFTIISEKNLINMLQEINSVDDFSKFLMKGYL